jgi:[ribosomal protein S5]-alanine N-acetyltransferase
MKLETERLVLRPIKKSDKKSLIGNINNLSVSKWLLAVPYPYTEKDADWWINHCKEKSRKKPRKGYSFAVELKSEKRLIGGFGLDHIDYEQGTADLGYWLGEKYWRKGYAREGISKIIDFAFEELGLRRLVIPAFSENKGSNGLAKALGFTYEGTLRETAVCKATGKIHSENVWSLLKREWKK